MSTAAEYRKLLAKYAPQPIRSDAEYRRALAQLEKLMVTHPGAARSQLVEVIATLIEKYESADFPNPRVPAAEMLAHLLEAKGIKSSTLAKATGIPAATLSNVLAHRRGISKENAVRLGKFFGLSPIVFLAEAASDLPSADRKRETQKA